MNKLITLIIPSYRSKKLILAHLKKLSNRYKIIIVENSYDTTLKRIIQNKYKNVNIYLKKNIGYGKAVNFASKKVKTKYFFVMNPDSKIYQKTLSNLIQAAEKIDKFGAIGPIYADKKNKYKKKDKKIEKKLIKITFNNFCKFRIKN